MTNRPTKCTLRSIALWISQDTDVPTCPACLLPFPDCTCPNVPPPGPSDQYYLPSSPPKHHPNPR